MNVDEFVEFIRKQPDYRGQIVHEEKIPAHSARYRSLEYPLPDWLHSALRRLGIERLYSHQAEAIDAARHGENVVVVTSTASGKTLCYNAPVLESLGSNLGSRALYIFPTKALAQDQLGKLREFGLPDGLKAATYDGDTPAADRRFIKANCQIVLTNPDMLHIGILPYHSTWSSFFRNLKYVVIDEIHSYRGVFGSHVANIVRRLRRICRHYGSNPQFVCASATIANPGELMRMLTGIEPKVIDRDGSPSGRKTFLFWNPPFIGQAGDRRSANSEATGLLVKLVEAGVRTIVFTLARKQAELILRYARRELSSEKPELTEKVMSYRAGYTPRERREIESRLFQGELLGVTSTTALELGVDVGGLDAAVLTGYPGTIASTWQQAGRAGRRVGESLAILIGMDNPLDQFLMRRPDYFFRQNPERAIADPENLYILAAHAVCAAYELPIENEEAELFGSSLYEVLAALADAGELSYRNRWYWTGAGYPAASVNIRSTSSDSYTIVDVGKGGVVMGTVDAANAFSTIHPGAVYLHGGESYIVEKLDVENKVGYVSLTDLPYYTVPSSNTSVTVDEEVESKEAVGGRIYFGDVAVTEVVNGYYRKQLFSDTVLAHQPLTLPPEEFGTEGVWVAVPETIRDRLIGRGYDLAGSLHAAEHASIGILPLFAMCDRQDIGGVSHPTHPDLDGLPAIFIYDAHPGGVGISRTAYERFEDLLEATLNAIENCECESGCPSCVQSPKCGSNNDPLDKDGAAFLLKELLNAGSKSVDGIDT